VVHVTAQAEPRSGLGLNELLGLKVMACKVPNPSARASVIVPAPKIQRCMTTQAWRQARAGSGTKRCLLERS